MAHKLLHPSCLSIACCVILAATCPSQDKKRIESTVKRLEAKLDQIEGYLQSLEPGTQATDPSKLLEQALAKAAAKEAALNEQVAKLDREFQQARRQIADLASMHKATAAEKAKLVETIDSLRQELTGAYSERETAQKSFTELKAAYRQQNDQDAAKLLVARETAAKALDETRAKLAQGIADNAELTKGLTIAKKMNRDQQAKERDLRNELAAASAHVKGSKDVATEHEAIIAHMRATAELLQAEHATAAKDLEAARAKLGQASTDNAELRKKLATAEKMSRGEKVQGSAFRKQLEVVSAQFAESRDVAVEQEATIQGMRATAETIRKRNADLSEQLAAAEQKLADAQAQSEEMRIALEASQPATPKTPTTILAEPGSGNGVEGGIHVHNDSGTVIVQVGGGEVEIDASENAGARPAAKSPSLPRKRSAENKEPPPAPSVGSAIVPTPTLRTTERPAAEVVVPVPLSRTVKTKTQPPEKAAPPRKRKINL